jgi:hypothetical protein
MRLPIFSESDFAWADFYRNAGCSERGCTLTHSYLIRSLSWQVRHVTDRGVESDILYPHSYEDPTPAIVARLRTDHAEADRRSSWVGAMLEDLRAGK